MNGSKKLLLMVIVGILIAAAIISSVNLLEQQHILPPVTSSTLVTTQTKTTTAISTGNLSTGKLAVQLTDPSSVPIGTSHLYVTYSDIEARTSSSLNPSLWFTIASTGTIDLMNLQNVSLTLGSAVVTNGTYNAIRLTITNASITYLGQNYSVSLSSNQLVMPILNGGVYVGTNDSAGVIVQLSSLVSGSQATSSDGSVSSPPGFVLFPAAKAIPIPAPAWNSSLLQTGSKFDLKSAPFVASSAEDLKGNVTVISVLLNKNSMLLVLLNRGNANVSISGVTILGSPYSFGSPANTTTGTSSTSTVTVTRTVTITQPAARGATSLGKGIIANNVADPSPAATTTSTTTTTNPTIPGQQQTIASFIALNNGTLIQPSGQLASSYQNKLGIVIQPNHTANLLFVALNGNIATLNSVALPNVPTGIVAGEIYTIVISNQFGSNETINVSSS